MTNLKTTISLTTLAAACLVTTLSGGRSAPVETLAPSAASPFRSVAPGANVGTDLLSALGSADLSAAGTMLFPVVIGGDLNNAQNPFVQPQNPALAGGGIDQSLQHHDLILGDYQQTTIMIGRLGEDVLAGGSNADIMIGGPEHFFPRNRDKAFGGFGDDIFMWAPGDGSDAFNGGPGEDTVIFGLIGEDDGTGNPVFQVNNNQQAGNVWLDQWGLPRIDVTNSPGFCEVIDPSTSATAGAELQAINVQRLVRFVLRGVNQNFLNGVQSTDNGLRVTLHLVDVEYLVCTSPTGGQIEAFDLRTSPPTPLPVSSLPFGVQFVTQ